MQHVVFASAYRQLQPVEKQFVDAYVTALEAAADRAGERISVALHAPVPPELVARSNGLLDRALVRAAISERVGEIAAASELSVGKVIRHLSAMAFSSMEDCVLFDPDTKLPSIDLKRLNSDQWLAVKSVEMETSARGLGVKTKVTFHDKSAAIFKYLEMFGLDKPDNPELRKHTMKEINAAPNVPAAVGQTVEQLSSYYQEILQASG